MSFDSTYIKVKSRCQFVDRHWKKIKDLVTSLLAKLYTELALSKELPSAAVAVVEAGPEIAVFEEC